MITIKETRTICPLDCPVCICRSLLQFLQCILQDRELNLNVVHQVLDLVLRVQHFDALRVGVVAHSKGSWDAVGVFAGNKNQGIRRSGLKYIVYINSIIIADSTIYCFPSTPHLHHLLLGVFKAVGYKVHGLVLWGRQE